MPAPMLASVGNLSDLLEVVDGVLVVKSDGLCQDDRYELSQKVDGRRLLVQLSGGVVTGFNRRGERTDVPRAVAARLALCPIDVVMDGELIGPTWHVFDLTEAHNAVTPQTPLRVRRTALETLVSTCGLESPALRLLPAATTTDAKERLSKRVIEAHAEGLMAKYIGCDGKCTCSGFQGCNGAYLYGKEGRGWRKLKLVKDVDCVAVEFGRGGHDNIVLAVYDDAGEMVEIGEVTRQAGDGSRVKLGDVLTVKYLAWSGTRLIQPTLPRIRTDKLPRECLLSQLVVARTKDVIEV